MNAGREGVLVKINTYTSVNDLGNYLDRIDLSELGV
jgi:hypothetical protein